MEFDGFVLNNNGIATIGDYTIQVNPETYTDIYILRYRDNAGTEIIDNNGFHRLSILGTQAVNMTWEQPSSSSPVDISVTSATFMKT